MKRKKELRTMKKAQMEILGVAFLFVLIIFGFLLYLSFAKPSSENPIDEYLEPKISSALTDVLLHTTVDCGKYGKRPLRELMIDCMTDPSRPQEMCALDEGFVNDPYHYFPTHTFIEKTSCETFALFLNVTLNKTLMHWGKPFYIEVYKDTDPDFEENPHDYLRDAFGEPFQYALPELGVSVCNRDARQRRSRTQPLPLNTYGNMIMVIGLCY